MPDWAKEQINELITLKHLSTVFYFIRINVYYSLAGHYDVQLLMKNNIFSELPVPVILEKEIIVNGLHEMTVFLPVCKSFFVDFGTVFVRQLSNVILYLQKMTPNLEVIILFGDGSQAKIDRSMFMRDHLNGAVWFRSITISHRYDTSGLYTVTTLAKDSHFFDGKLFGRLTAMMTIEVKCSLPWIVISGARKRVELAVPVKHNSFIKYDVEYGQDCAPNEKINFQWILFTKYYKKVMLDESEVQCQMNVSKININLFPFTMDFGLYKLEVMVRLI